MNIIDAINDPNLFRPFLADRDDSLETWSVWMSALKLLHGLPIEEDEWPQLTEVTGRTEPINGGAKTALFLTGRRSGKSRTAAIVASFEAALAGHERKLAVGETGLVMVVAPSKSQARIVTDYIRGVFQVPLLAGMVKNETKEGLELTNNIRIEIAAADWRTIRGFSLVAAVVDEAAFLGYEVDSKVKSDTELINAMLPALGTTGGRLIAISSPYAKKGWCYRQYNKHFGNDSSDVLVLNAPSRTLNSTLPQSVVDAAMADDPASARAEYLGQFRDDVASFLSREVIEAVVVKGRQVLAMEWGETYRAFADISGGRSDDAALAIGHQNEQGLIVVDYLRRWRPPFNPDAVIGEMVADLARYHVSEVVGDNYSAEFTKQAFESRGVVYSRATVSEFSDAAIPNPVTKSKSQLYVDLIPRITSGRIELLDNETLVNQLASLERKVRMGGRDIVDHPQGQHDDLANAVAGVVDVCIHAPKTMAEMFPGYFAPEASGGGGRAGWASLWAERIAEYDRDAAYERKQIEQSRRGKTWVDALEDGTLRILGQ